MNRSMRVAVGPVRLCGWRQGNEGVKSVDRCGGVVGRDANRAPNSACARSPLSTYMYGSPHPSAFFPCAGISQSTPKRWNRERPSGCACTTGRSTDAGKAPNRVWAAGVRTQGTDVCACACLQHLARACRAVSPSSIASDLDPIRRARATPFHTVDRNSKGLWTCTQAGRPVDRCID